MDCAKLSWEGSLWVFERNPKFLCDFDGDELDGATVA